MSNTTENFKKEAETVEMDLVASEITNEDQGTKADDSHEVTLRALRCWNEISEKAASGDVTLLPFLKMARAFIDNNGKIYIRYPNEFVKNMVDGANVFDGILAATRIELKRDVSPSDLVFGLLEGDEDLTEFDDLII